MGDEKTAGSVIRKVQSATKSGGYNLIDFFIKWPGIKDEQDRFIPMSGKLQDFYKDWKIIKYVERPKLFYNGEWEKTAWMIARKPITKQKNRFARVSRLKNVRKSANEILNVTYEQKRGF